MMDETVEYKAKGFFISSVWRINMKEQESIPPACWPGAVQGKGNVLSKGLVVFWGEVLFITWSDIITPPLTPDTYRQTVVKQNITLPHISFADGKNSELEVRPVSQKTS